MRNKANIFVDTLIAKRSGFINLIWFVKFIQKIITKRKNLTRVEFTKGAKFKDF